jgi:diaminopimelate epimerase
MQIRKPNNILVKNKQKKMIHFYKYQGAGNDFILIDNRLQQLRLNTQQIHFLCDRKMGIGADGLMLLEEADAHDFRMVYFNADGNESTMCGNGGRCITAFAQHLGIIENKASFSAIDGDHEARFTTGGLIALDMNDVDNIAHYETHSILNTGSPHYVVWAKDVEHIDVVPQGRAIRNQEAFAPKGINVNFTAQLNNGLFVRTYERGVEDETLSCGTGVTAAAIAATKDALGDFETSIKTLGGPLKVSFTKNTATSAIKVVLTGPAQWVFEGHINL